MVPTRRKPGASLVSLSDLRKQRHDDEDLWPISLADMMTLLLCFFLLIVAVSHVDLNRYERVADSMQKAMVTDRPAPRQKTAEAPPVTAKTAPPKPEKAPEPSTVRSKVSHTTLKSETPPPEPEKPKEHPAPSQAVAQPKPGEAQPAPAAKAPQPPAKAPENERTGPTRKSLDDIRKELAGKLDIASGAVEIVPRENGVELSLRGAAFFDLASADIKPAGLPLLRDIAATLAGTPYKVTVEGHTDNLPIESWLYPSNWELSSARASRVARFLIDHGVAREHLRVEGLADTMPVAPNTDEAGRSLPENQAKNRRVVILVSPS
ncbi:OmpA family protein [Solidesulfovibrio sp.]|uniref:OmpA family protein n=1 Tax=Solidesulfovibrio sp. TaxID=2910990 RepID=UPI000EC3830F|nr:OmpA family protein [Solidesulfovibrio sp.]MEA5089328.1 OmpA family protein [Solidesulfovibrio sp.]HCR14081.1 chemotaxis protein MotB [Desulfovibrio sp.]HML60313.1 OmpA family protein [Solidesulfovibrio sp.]